MNIEHNINYQKVIIAAPLLFICILIDLTYNIQKHFAGKGVHGTASHLENLSPVTKVYRPLRKMFCKIGNLYPGSKHTNPNTDFHVSKIRRKIAEARLYDQGTSRLPFGTQVKPVKDIVKVSYMLFEY